MTKPGECPQEEWRKLTGMSNFERKFGKYAIKNLSLMLIMCYAVGYLITFINPLFLGYLRLNPYAILHGQIWRLVTWVVVPPPSSNVFFVLIMLYLYYSLGTSLERTWGTYRYNVYLFSGMLFTVLGSFLLMIFAHLLSGMTMEAVSIIGSEYFSTYYINMSIFLAFAATFPEVEMLLMFIIPIKVKVLGIIYGVVLLVEFFFGNIYSRFAMAASLFNFLVFWIGSKNHIHMSPRQVKRRQQFKREVRRNTGVTKHKCAICGRTELDGDDLEFRICSKCEGNYEYCQDHLFTHQHVKYH